MRAMTTSSAVFRRTTISAAWSMAAYDNIGGLEHGGLAVEPGRSSLRASFSAALLAPREGGLHERHVDPGG